MDASNTARKAFTRWQASGLHLLISAVIATCVLTAMLGVWYPRPLFEVEGGPGLLFILVGVDVVIGPLITLVIFTPGKPGLKGDLVVIGTLQMLALIYGCYVMFAARPAFIVLVKGQFEVVSVADLKGDWLDEALRPEFRAFPLSGPVLVVSDPPANEAERRDILFSAISGARDMQHFPKYYVPYAERLGEVRSQGQTMASVRKRYPANATVIDRYLAESGRADATVLYLPMRAMNGWGAVLVDAKSGELVKILQVPE